MAENFPGIVPEGQNDDDSTDSVEKKSSKKTGRERLLPKASKEKKPETPEAPKEKAHFPLEKLAADEKPVIAAEIARVRGEQASQKAAETTDNTEEKAETETVAEFDAALQRQLETGLPVEAALDQAEAETIEKFELPNEATDENLDTPTQVTPETPAEVEDMEGETSVEAGDDHETNESTHDEDAAVDAESVPDEPDDADESDDPAAPHGSGSSGSGSSGANPSGGRPHGGGSGTPSSPPPPPRAPVPPPPPHGPTAPPPPMGPPAGGPPVGGNLAPASANLAPTNANVNQTVDYEQRSVAPYLLVGGLIGYLVGRRRGRIKTEKRLLPIQAKLEQEVVNLEQQIIDRENKIRSLKRSQIARQTGVDVQERASRSTQTPIEKSEARSERPKTAPAPERIGKLAFKSETIKLEHVRTPTLNPAEMKPVEIMTVAELMKIAERIKIEESDLKKLFESNRLNDRGLRRVIEAYLRGEKYVPILQKELRSQADRVKEVDPMAQTQAASQNGTQAAGLSSVGAPQARPYSYGNNVQMYDRPAQNVPQPYSAVDPYHVAGGPQDTPVSHAKSSKKRKSLTSNNRVRTVIVVVVLLAIIFTLVILGG